MISADPHVYALAEAFVNEMLDQVGTQALSVRVVEQQRQREALVSRAAAAMQQAVEQELEAIRAELVG
jgi:uncharacterized protein (DUF305 family)